MSRQSNLQVNRIVEKVLAGENFSFDMVQRELKESIIKEPDGSKSVLIVFPKHSPHLPFIHNGERCHAKIVSEVPAGNYQKTAFTSPGFTVYVNMDEVNKNMRFNPYAFIAVKAKKSGKVTEEVELEKDIKVLCDKADAELKKLIKWLKDNESAFLPQDLKLYSAAFYDLSKKFPDIQKAVDEENYDPFYGFCESEYDSFLLWCDEQGIDFQKMTQAVWGSNSKFYLYKDDMIVLEGNHGRERGIDVQSTIYNFINYFEYESSFDVTEDGLVDREFVGDWYAEDEYVELNLKDIASGSFYKDVTNYYEDVIKVYNQIKYVKDNQVQFFEEWLENDEEFVRDQYPELFEDELED